MNEPMAVNIMKTNALNEDQTLATADEDGNADPNGTYVLRQSILDENGNPMEYAVDGYYTSAMPWGGLNAAYFLP